MFSCLQTSNELLSLTSMQPFNVQAIFENFILQSLRPFMCHENYNCQVKYSVICKTQESYQEYVVGGIDLSI